jgi:hypothetical protein
MSQFQEKLAAIEAQIRKGVAPQRETVQSFLLWFGAERRGYRVVHRVRQAVVPLCSSRISTRSPAHRSGRPAANPARSRRFSSVPYSVIFGPASLLGGTGSPRYRWLHEPRVQTSQARHELRRRRCRHRPGAADDQPVKRGDLMRDRTALGHRVDSTPSVLSAAPSPPAR